MSPIFFLLEEIEGKVPLNPALCEEDLANDLNKLLLSSDFSDVKFEVEGNYVDAHRNILTARSAYFKSFLCDNLKADRLLKPIRIENITCVAFKALISYLYTNRIEEKTNPVVACELMRASEWYNIENLATSCYLYIEESLTIENVMNVYKCSVSIEPILSGITELCLDYTALNFPMIIEREDFQNLPQPDIIRLTQHYAKNRATQPI
jgi:hypothetical protein